MSPSNRALPTSEAASLSPYYQYLLSFCVMAAAGAIMLHISWGKWGDFIVDYGREMYIPWQLSEGKILYRDIYVNQYGPFAPYSGPSSRPAFFPCVCFCRLPVKNPAGASAIFTALQGYPVLLSVPGWSSLDGVCEARKARDLSRRINP
jgi:hypothetical protein